MIDILITCIVTFVSSVIIIMYYISKKLGSIEKSIQNISTTVEKLSQKFDELHEKLHQLREKVITLEVHVKYLKEELEKHRKH